MEAYELDALLEEISSHKGGGTWHVSFFVRPSKDIQQARNEIASEIAEAESIKSDKTRFRVQNALKSIRTALSEYRNTPDNGIVVFASPKETFVLDDLPFSINENLYHCGKEFLTERLRSGFDAGGSYGLIVVERGRAAIGVLHRGRIESVLEKESMVMGKTQAGGQSQARYERLREKQLHEFFGNVQESAYGTFKGYDLDGVVIGGTLSTAKKFSKKYTNHEWNVLDTFSVDHGDKQGLEELVEKASDQILNEEQSEVREALDRFLLGLRDGMSEYGGVQVRKALKYGAVDTLLLSGNLGVDEINDYKELAQETGADVLIVSGGYEEAEMFENISGGVGALLRYEL